MSLPVPSFHSKGPPASPQQRKEHCAACAPLAQTPVGLEHILEQARHHLALRLHALAEPWPGCVLVFSVAHAAEPASVFHIKANTFQSAWREGSIRVRQWAWARRVDTAALRIDWAEEVVLYPAGHRITTSGVEQLRRKNSALADLACEQTILLQQALLAPAAERPKWADTILSGHAALESFLVLHMRGIFLDPYSTALTQLPRNTLPPRQERATSAGMGAELQQAGHGALMGLIAQQTPSGSWPQSSALDAHLHIHYTLLLWLRSEQPPATASAKEALLQALAAASDYTASQRPQEPPHQAWALLVLSLSATALGPSAHPLARLFAAMHSLALQTEQALDTALRHDAAHPPQLSNPSALASLQTLALHAYARSGAGGASAARHSSKLEWPLSGLQLLGQCFANAHHSPPPWLSMALIEACQHPVQPSIARPHSPLVRRRTLQQLDALQQRFVWPETAIYMQHRLQMPPLFIAESWPAATEQTQAPIAQQALWFNQMGACLALLQCFETTTPSINALPALDEGSAANALPAMRWSGQSLAKLTAGQWHLPQGMLEPTTVSGLTVVRQNHAQGAAVLVRHTGDSLGVPAAVAPSLQPCALVQVAGNPIHPSFPVLEIPDLGAALQRLAQRARQRVQAQVIGVTGCAGKTSTLRMLSQCLFGSSSAQQDAIVQHAPALQMLHWSENAAWALAELPFETAPEHLQMLAPDVLVVTNFPPAAMDADSLLQASHTEQALLQLMSGMRPGSLIVVDSSVLPHEVLQAMAASSQIRLSSFGTHPAATIHEHRYEDSGQLHIQLQPAASTPPSNATEILSISLQANGHHMARNTQAALAVLHAMQLPLATSAAALRHWSPLAGAGQAEYLQGNRVLLDHSNTSELLAAQAAFVQLLSHAPLANQRLIVFGGIKAYPEQTGSLPMAQMQLEPLLRSTVARRVLLYGQAMASLAQQLHDLHQVSWYQDLNQLIDSLIRTLQPHDTVLLIGRAIVNLSIVAEAIREIAD